MNILALLLIYAIIVLWQVPALIKKGYWRELWAFSFFCGLALILNLLQMLGIKIPSPMNGIHYVIEDMLHVSYRP